MDVFVNICLNQVKLLKSPKNCLTQQKIWKKATHESPHWNGGKRWEILGVRRQQLLPSFFGYVVGKEVRLDPTLP